ncbi:G5 domain-containing protein, partial [Corynebacterium sp. HMSC29G08]|uniref:G5 domain-containing protein n=1 Tax=Corynebacterium sp. HMSC29G08 TaxID=1581069 RepID=UPI000A47BD99
NPDGEATVEEKITQPPVDQVIKVGTKPTEASSKVSWTAQVPFAVETRPNSELAPGEVKVVQKGVPGEKTYTADFAATGSDATVTPEEKQTKDPINEIIEYGPTPADTSVVTKTEKPVPFETKIVFDATLEAGTQVVDTQGELGIDEVTSTQKIVDGKPSGDPEVTTERTKEPVTQVIRVGTKSKPVSADVDWNERTSFDTEVRVNPDLAPGETKVIQEGTPGEVKHTVKVTVDNGKVSREESTETISDPKPRIVDVGPTVGESELTDTHAQDISYETIIEEDPNLEAGKVVEDQAGVVGQKEITTTWKLVNGQPVGEPETSETVTKESQPRKVRVGTKCNCSTPSDPTPPTDPDSGKKGSSEKAERCVANAFATNSPLLWLLPIGLLAGVGYGVNEAFGPQIQSVSAEFNARINEALPHTDFGSSHGEQPEWVRGLQMQIDGINSQFAGFGEQLKPLGIALGAIAALALVGSLIAQACTEEGFDNGMTVWGIKDGSSVPGKRPQEWSSQE